MSDRQRVIFSVAVFFLMIFALFKIGAIQVGAYTVSNVRSLVLDQSTLAKGFTVKSYDEKMLVPIFPKQYQKPLAVKIQTLADNNALPSGLKAISGFYTYEIQTGRPGFLAQPAVVALKYDSVSAAAKKILYYDNYRQSWRELESWVDANERLIKARTIFPYAQIVAVESAAADEFTAKSIIVADKTGRIIFEKNSREVRPIASLTKLMAAQIFLEHNPGWDKTVTIVETDNVGGASLPVEAGDLVRVKDLFAACLLGSKNNAARALMRSTGLSENEFVLLMNQRAVSWGLTSTRFVEPTGLSELNVSTAEEMLEISRRLFNQFAVLEATTRPWYSMTIYRQGQPMPYSMKNTNKLVERDLYITGGKTGYTEEAGYNLVTQARNNGHEVIALVMGAQIRQNYEEVYLLLKRYL